MATGGVPMAWPENEWRLGLVREREKDEVIYGCVCFYCQENHKDQCILLKEKLS